MKNASNFKNDIEVFSGFKPAIEACFMNWDDYVIPGVTYSQDSRLYHCPFTCFRHTDLNQINASSSVLNCEHPPMATHHNPHHHAITSKNRTRSVNLPHRIYFTNASPYPVPLSTHLCSIIMPTNPSGGNRSSVSSEGFCENDADADILGPSNLNDTDGEASESSSSGTGAAAVASTSGLRVSDWSDSDSSAQTEQRKQQASTSNHAANFKPAAEAAALASPAKAEQSTVTGDEAANPASPPAVAAAATAEKWDSSNSDSQQSGDEYNVYYYDPKALLTANNAVPAGNAEDEKKDEPSIFGNVRKIEEPWEILFARAEALHAHGHSKEACFLGVKWALELLANPPDLMVDLPPIQSKGKRKKVSPTAMLNNVKL
jgi:hypothetical protein